MFAAHCKREMLCCKWRNSLIVPVSLLAIIITFCSNAAAVTSDCSALEELITPYTCDSGRCINASRVCDGSNDCLDWSDERDCGNQTCESYQFQCHENNNCINGVWKCDGDEDCSDGSDEKDCDTQNCSEKEFQCSNGRCLPLDYKCDGDNDCNDNSDEPDNCPPLVCRDYQFKCEVEDTCISNNWVCDGEEDCDDGSDERNCSTINTIECNIGKFDCGPSATGQRCIEYTWLCDGEDDCSNGADEAMCKLDNRTDICHAGQFACSSGECIPEEWQCDGDDDCTDAVDEENCEATCGPHQFHCTVSGECISGNLVCNGLSDCVDGSDEQLSSCADIIQPYISCAPNLFQCSDLSRCLTGDQHCDNRSHCADGSDEHNCSHVIDDECQRNNGGCAQICHNTPRSYFCSCRHGYKINVDRRSCDDIDECVYFTPCAQHCHNTEGSYNCSCIEGFTSDGPYCVNNSDGDAWLLYSDRSDLRRISTDDSHSNKILISGLNYPLAMDYHYRLGYVFWTDYSMKKIQRGYLNGSGPITTVIHRGLEEPTGIAVDWINDKIYWTDSLTKLIEVSDLDGSNRLALVWSNLELPRPIVLDPFNRHMYWSDWGINARIERASMDGSNRVVLHGTRLVWPNALSIDLIGERLYWADAKLHVIEVSHLDGSHRRVIAEELKHPFSMTLFGQYLYYTDWQVGGVLRVNRLWNNYTTKVLLETDHITSMGVKAVHPSLQQSGSNPCHINNGGCSHLCLLSATSLGQSSCACPTGYKIDQSKKRCLPLDKYILFSRSVDIRRISLDTPSLVDVMLPVNGLQYTIGLDWSGERNTFYWCDYLTGTINVASLEGNDQRVLINHKGSQPVGLAVDWINDKLYWTDSKLDRIEVLDLNTSQRSVLVSTGLDKPRGIAVHPSKGLMFWTDWGYIPKIERANMDGSERVTLINTGLTWPNGITIDYDQELIYWVDADNLTRGIEYCDFNGNGRTVLINEMLLHPFGITLFKDHVYWTDWETNKVERADKLTGDNRVVVHANLGRLMDITVVHSDRATAVNPCAVSNGGCNYMCLLSPAATGDGLEPSCACPTGVSLLDDNKTCASRIHDYILFSVYNGLRKVSLDIPHPVDERVNLSSTSNINIVSITVDPVTEDIFWSDNLRYKIIRLSQATGEIREIPKLGSTKSEGLAVDWLSQQVYWSDIDSKTIEVSDYDGSVRSLLLSRDNGLSGPRAVTLDLKNRYLLFVDWQIRGGSDYTAVIKRAEMDGSNLRTIVESEEAGLPGDIAIDYQGDSTRLYWTKSIGNSQSIAYTNIHGKHYNVLLDNLEYSPYGLSVMLGRMYWSSWGHPVITSADKMTGSNKRVEYDFTGRTVGDIHVFSSNYTVITDDYPCRRGDHPCSHLCLPNTSNRGYRCACTTGITLEDNTCSSAPDGFIVYAELTRLKDGKKIQGSIQRIPIGATTAYQTTLVPHLNNPVALEYYYSDDHNGYIYWSDPDDGFIGRVAFDGSGPVTVVNKTNTDALAVDWISGNLYWADYAIVYDSQGVVRRYENYTISVSRLDGRYRKMLISGGLGSLRGLSILPREGKIFWNDYDYCKARIEAANLDGSGRHVVVQLNDNYTECHQSCQRGSLECLQKYTNQMELNYTSNELYWVDSYQDILEAVHINGSNHRVLQNLTFCFGLGLDINDVYVTSWLEVDETYSLLKWHNSPSSNIQLLRDDIIGIPMDVAVVRRDKRPAGVDDLNACAVNNGGCPYLCLPVNHTHRRCACPDALSDSCTEYVGLAPTPAPTTLVVSTTTSAVSKSVSMVVMETTATDDFIIIPTPPTSTTAPGSPQSNTGDGEDLTGSLVAAYVVLAAMLVVLFVAMILIIMCIARRKFPDRCITAREGRRNSFLAVYGRFRSRKLPEEASNGWNEKPNNFVDQLPTTKQLSAPLGGGACVPSAVTHKNSITKDSDTLFPKTVNVKAPLNVDPDTPPSPLSPTDEAALVRIEPSKVVFESNV